MKKRLMAALLLLTMLLPLTAQAFSLDSESSWNKVCKWRTTRSTTLYSLSYRDGKTSWGPDENPADDAIFTPVGTLASGKYVMILSGEMCGKIEVFYWAGGRRNAWIEADAYARDTVQITSTTGQKTSIPSKAYGDADAVRYILSEYYSDADVQAWIDGMRNQMNGSGSGDSGSTGSGSGGSTSSGSNNGGGTTTYTVRQGESLALPTITLTTAAEDGTPASAEVKMVLPGLLTSVVTLEGKEQSVPTVALSWEKGEAEHALAIIYAPNTGLATLWETSGGKYAICKLKAGSVVLVLEKGGKYTKVLGEEKVGYVLTDALTLTDPAEDGTEKTTTRQLTLRLTARTSGRALASLPKGTAVTVLQEKGNWALVEHEGFAGYVLKKYLKK